MRCNKCSCYVHWNCSSSPHSAIADSSIVLRWVCADCRVCVECQGDLYSEEVVRCAMCEDAIHISCFVRRGSKPGIAALGEPSDLSVPDEFPDVPPAPPKLPEPGAWKCRNCVCLKCGGEIGDSSYTLCRSCSESLRKKQRCLVCKIPKPGSYPCGSCGNSFHSLCFSFGGLCCLLDHVTHTLPAATGRTCNLCLLSRKREALNATPRARLAASEFRLLLCRHSQCKSAFLDEAQRDEHESSLHPDCFSCSLCTQE
jgi:hypothetical protein